MQNKYFTASSQQSEVIWAIGIIFRSLTHSISFNTLLGCAINYFPRNFKLHSVFVERENWNKHSPKQTPVPIIGGFDIHFKGASHIPEKPPNPPEFNQTIKKIMRQWKFIALRLLNTPHVSPTVFAHTLQHLKEECFNTSCAIKEKNFNRKRIKKLLWMKVLHSTVNLVPFSPIREAGIATSSGACFQKIAFHVRENM